ncbi:hypothetical protein PHMEG_00023237 [Phytophthora megakarya]|uniref:Reverse transcriptase n=1 Tax=Phytophthora megakarya TaxID=4795 RepID=A0A225VIL2_9STRA|nr:hypothetical protein PHMEG_00023237 [Phytophthora megakarya]
MAGDVASAFHNISIHSNSVYFFAGQIEEENVIIIELSAPFGWTGSPGFYEISPTCMVVITMMQNPTGFFNYHWVDDHINVASNVGTTLNDMDRSLRFAMEAIFGAEGISDEKFTPWATRQRILGLEFDSTAELVRMPQTKIDKARRIIVAAYAVTVLSRKAYRSLLGSLRQVATCIRAARHFLQRLRIRERHLHRFQSVDASDFGLCALDITAEHVLTYRYTPTEIDLITDFKAGAPNSFVINYREQLSCAFAVHAGGGTMGIRQSR